MVAVESFIVAAVPALIHAAAVEQTISAGVRPKHVGI